MLDHKVILDWFGPRGWRAAHLARMIVWRITRPMRIGVFGIIFNKEGQVLLVENSYAPGWRLPGGGVEWGETVEQSLIRELKEEVQLTARSPKLLKIYLSKGYGASNHIITFRIDDFDGTAKADGNEILRVLWADPANLPPGMVPIIAEQIALGVTGAAA